MFAQPPKYLLTIRCFFSEAAVGVSKKLASAIHRHVYGLKVRTPSGAGEIEMQTSFSSRTATLIGGDGGSDDAGARSSGHPSWTCSNCSTSAVSISGECLSPLATRLT